jgi:eukaryotic-like serine/threonine-protein kinase
VLPDDESFPRVVTAPRILIIDDQPAFRALLGHHITTRWPDAAVRHVDPLTGRGPPDEHVVAEHDVILLGDPVGQADALLWLRQLHSGGAGPPVIFLGNGDERQIVAAVKAGAHDYVAKSGLSHRRLIEAVEGAVTASASIGDRSEGKSLRAESKPPGLVHLKGYEFQRQLAFGEISAVYLARQVSTGRIMVLKVLNQVPDRGGEKAFDRFVQEYELIATVDHPNVVKIFDLGVADDHAYIAMEYCSRGSLKRRIGGGMTTEQAFLVMREIAGALSALHAVGIFHRDLKPTNVMFRDDDSLVLIDFGLAKQAHFHAEITGTGAIFGTPYYMSPEQGAAGQADQRSDIYSLGIILYEMLTGKKPFDGASAMAVIIQHREAPIPRLAAPLAHYKPLIDKMLAKDPAQRFQSVAELLAWRPVLSGREAKASG